jgi:hypothetical protein
MTFAAFQINSRHSSGVHAPKARPTQIGPDVLDLLQQIDKALGLEDIAWPS